MRISILIGHIPVSLDINSNLNNILKILSKSKENDLVIFPEGSISGYDTQVSFLSKIKITELDNAMRNLQEQVIKRNIHVWIGTCLFEENRWYNCALGLTPNREVFRYDKVNLATHERGIFTHGSKLRVFNQNINNEELTIGVQLCRELKYSEQWRWLAINGAKLFLHLNNSIGNPRDKSIWRSQLISRATENQRYVISVNCASNEQTSPTIIIDPRGEVLEEISSGQDQFIRTKIDLDLVSDYYINQSRVDLLELQYKGK